MSEDVNQPFIQSAFRVDVMGRLAREHSERVATVVNDLLVQGVDAGVDKKDGKDGGKDAGEAGFWDKKDGKDGGSKDGKDGGSKDGGKEGGKDSSDKGKEGKEGGKDTSDKGKEGKEGGKDTSDKGKDAGKEGSKDGSKDGTKEAEGDKFIGSENEIIRHGDEFVVLPVDVADQLLELHTARMTTLLSQPIV